MKSCIFSWKFSLMSLILIAFMAVIMSGQAAVATSCMPLIYGEFLSPSGVIPANSRGVVWWGELQDKDTFSNVIFRIISASGEEIAVEYELLFNQNQNRPMYLVRPKAGFIPGQTYKITAERILDNQVSSQDQIRIYELLKYRFLVDRFTSVSISVSSDQVLEPNQPVELKIKGPFTEILRLKPFNIRPDARVNQLQLEMNLPARLKPFKEQLYYETYVDGKIWINSEPGCKQPTPGKGRLKRAEDLVFSSCIEYLEQGLKPGKHSVMMRALLPGAFVSIDSEVQQFEIQCLSERDAYKENLEP